MDKEEKTNYQNKLEKYIENKQIYDFLRLCFENYLSCDQKTHMNI